MAQIDKITDLQVRFQFLALTLQMVPLVPMQQESSVLGGSPKLKQVCAICLAERDIESLSWITYQRNLDFPHEDNCTYGSLVADFMVQMAQPTDLLNDERS
jgi:hypothetical protein